MTIKVTANGASASKPGTYPAVKVQNLTGFPLQPTGIVAICGEAVGGEPGVLDVLEGPAIQAAKTRYKSGPIADALGLLVTPSKDPRVANGASRIIVYKVNPGTQSIKALQNSATSPVNQVTLKSKNWGVDENNLGVKLVAGSVLDSNAKLTGTVSGPFTLAGGETLILKMFGTTYTFTNTLTGAATAAALMAELNTAARWSGSVKPVIASLDVQKLIIAVDPTVVTGAYLEYGYLLVDAISTLDTVVGITGFARGVRGTRTVLLKKGTTVEDAIPELGGRSVINVKYVGAGTACVMSIQDSLGNRVLTTTCTGAAADDLSLTLGVTENGVLVNKMTIAELVEVINNHAAYEASVTYSDGNLPTTDLDFYSAVHIESVALDLHRDIEDTVDQITLLSSLAAATRVSNISGQLAIVSSYVFFTGGSDGVATNANWTAAFEAFKEIRAEIVVPLISKDIGSVSIATVNALADAHCNYGWSATGRSPRQAFVSLLGSKTTLKSAARSLNSGYTSMFGQDVKVFSHSQQALVFLDPWAAACIGAGMMAGSDVGEPITFKYANVNDIRVRDGSWNPRVEFTEMIDAGCTILEAVDSGGFRFVVGNTTYSTDASFVWNRSSVVEAVGFLYYDLMVNLEAQFTGTKAKTGTAEAIANLIKARMEAYRNVDIIVGDDLNEGNGFKDLRVKIGGVGIGGNTAVIDLTVTPVQGVDFILPTIYLADTQQSA